MVYTLQCRTHGCRASVRQTAVLFTHYLGLNQRRQRPVPTSDLNDPALDIDIIFMSHYPEREREREQYCTYPATQG